MKPFASVRIVLGAALVVCAASVAHAQKSKDTMRLGMNAHIQGITYYLDPNPNTVFQTEAIQDNLIIFDEKSYKFEPLLAKAWRRIDDKTLEFDLRDDVKWHDGEKFDSDDVAYTFNWILDPKSKIRFKGNWEFIERVEKMGPFRLRIHAKTPTPYDLTRLAYLSTIEAEHAHGAGADKIAYAAGKPVGTGMYKVVEIDRNKHILLERHKGYNHGGVAKPASNIGRLQIIPILDSGTQVAQFLIGGIDILRDPGLSTAEDLAQKPGVEIAMGQGTSFMYMAIDAKGRSGVPALTDVRVRRALMMAVNRADILEFVTHGRKIPAPKAMCWDFQAGCAYSRALYPYDPDGAKKLLAEAGYPNGFELEITTFTNQSNKSVAQIVANQWSKIGVKASVAPTEIGAYRKKQGDGKIQVIVTGWPGGGNPDTQGTIEFIYDVPESRDYTGDQMLKDLAAKSLTVMDPQERQNIGRQVFDRSTELAYFMPVGPGPSLFVHTSELSVKAGAFSAFGLNPQGLRWK